MPTSAPPPPNFSLSEFCRWRKINEKFAVEIGCGVGYHPISWAKQNSDGQILAIERTKEKFEKFKRRLSHHLQLLPQIFPAHCDAAWLLPHALPANSVDEYFWLYPNPEPKRRNHRIAFAALTRFVISTLKTNGRLTIATNIPTYADEIRLWLPAKFPLALECEQQWRRDSFHYQVRSHFEKKYLERGDVLFNFEFSKTFDYSENYSDSIKIAGTRTRT